MRLAVTTYSLDEREALIAAIHSDGGVVLRQEEHYGGATGTCIFFLCDVAQWLKSNHTLLEGVVAGLIANPLYEIAKHLAIRAHKVATTPAPPAVAGIVADLELYGMFARAYLSATEQVPIQETSILQTVPIGRCMADTAVPYFSQILGSSGEPWLTCIAATETKYFAITLDVSGSLVTLHCVGEKPGWMYSKNR